MADDPIRTLWLCSSPEIKQVEAEELEPLRVSEICEICEICEIWIRGWIHPPFQQPLWGSSNGQCRHHSSSSGKIWIFFFLKIWRVLHLLPTP